MKDDMLKQIGEVIGTALAWFIAITVIGLSLALTVGIGHTILVYFEVL